MSKKFTVHVADNIYEDLKRWADIRGQNLAPTAATAIEQAVLAAKQRGEIPTRPQNKIEPELEVLALLKKLLAGETVTQQELEALTKSK